MDAIYDIVWNDQSPNSKHQGDEIRFVKYVFDDSDWEDDDSDKHSTSPKYEQRVASEPSSAVAKTATTTPYNPEGSPHSSTDLITKTLAEDPLPTHRAYFRYGPYRATFSCVEIRGPPTPDGKRTYADYSNIPFTHFKLQKMNKSFGHAAPNASLQFKRPHEQGKEDEKGNTFLEYEIYLRPSCTGPISVDGWAKKRVWECEYDFPGDWSHECPEECERAVLTRGEKRLLLGTVLVSGDED